MAQHIGCGTLDEEGVILKFTNNNTPIQNTPQ